MSEARRKVLLIDPDEFLVRVMAGRLELAGFDPVFTTDPNMVKGILAGDHFDLVLTELYFPLHDGFQLLKDIRSSREGIKIVVLTMLFDESSMRMARDIGVDEYMLKNHSTMEDLTAKLGELTS